MKKKYIIIIILFALVLLVVFKLSSNKKIINEKNRPRSTQNIRIPVKTAMVFHKQIESGIVKTGNLIPYKQAKVLAGASGTLSVVNFNLGDIVAEGQLLALADTRVQQLELEKAQSIASKLRTDLNTYTELLQGQAATQEQVNNLKQDYTNALNQVAQAKKNMSNTKIKAPISGMIASKIIEQGMFINAGAEVATIVNLAKINVQVNLSEAEAYQVHKEQQVRISTDIYPGETFVGRVSFISPQADQANNFLTEIQVDNNSRMALRAGTFVYVDFQTKNTAPALVIPREAVIQSIQKPAVYVVQHGAAKLRTIQVGQEAAGFITVLSGLKAGEQVVSSGQINLKDGSLISIPK
ncbi:RND family efflux transporter MFP subunit [Pedobacter sp. AK013]|uniref:efflux RND transporter periplasmic adaptor subunit n=1 Tax=Pedobacter sp. AK013 TaxID=2723071 RepID=UPI00160B3FBC|nr:efflux RND transporter periplasmic adaptor subunit [Pedobacter sp. AK013]MBB6239933.1 RND family efflux transporter MFP subunit [Pedobacter sp. AK013]